MEKKTLHLSWGKLAVACALATSSHLALASGFQLLEYNGAGMGNFQAGGAAIADDASTVFANPAGLARLTAHPELVLSGDWVSPETNFHGLACGGVNCVPQHVSHNGGKKAIVPAGYVSYPINDSIVLGLGFYGPFGLSTDYGQGNLLSYSASKSEVKTVNITPAMSFRFNEHFSIGAGLSAQKMSATLDSVINFFPPQTFNTSAKNNADDWAYGFNVGALYEFNEHTRIGASFISHVEHDLRGTSKLVGGSIPSLTTNQLKSNIDLPATTTASFFHDFNEQWSVMGTVIYTKWDSLQQIVLQNAAIPALNPAGGRLRPILGSTLGTVTIPENFRNTWRAALGVDYQVTPQWRLRVGAGYDQSPVNNKDRNIRLADANRIAAAAGIRFSPIETVKLDLGYTHEFIKDGKIHQPPIVTTSTLSKSIGKNENSVDIVGVQLTWDVT